MTPFVKYACFGIQLAAAITLSIFCGLWAHNNQWGQNIINISACLTLFARLQNIVAFYRLYLNQPYLQNHATLLFVFGISFGKVLEMYNPTNPDYTSDALNKLCFLILSIVLGANLLYYLLFLVAIVLYIIKQIFKLMKGTILSSSATLLEQELNAIKNSGRPFIDILRERPDINPECSICLSNFERDNVCIVLPGCGHCFHSVCIDEWLSNKSSCPYCRSNIRLGLMRG